MSRAAQTPPRKGRSTPAVASRSPAAPVLPWRAGIIAKMAIGAFAALLLALTFTAHPIGDYFTESDFYEYAAGGSGIRQGLVDPSRYVIIGPLYEFVLAALGLLPFELFRVASLLSIASACAVLALWFQLLRRRGGDGIALATVCFLAAKPVFFRYAYTASTDMLAMALQAASLFAMLAMGGKRAPLWAGLFAGLAILTRYTSIYLVPGALIMWIWGGSQLPRRKLGPIARYALGLGLVVVPWTVFALASGAMPGRARERRPCTRRT